MNLGKGRMQSNRKAAGHPGANPLCLMSSILLNGMQSQSQPIVAFKQSKVLVCAKNHVNNAYMYTVWNSSHQHL